jgi:hypothetical protein
MSLCVDLITQEERRSGGAINVKSIVRVSSIVFPILVLFAVGHQFLKVMQTTSKLQGLESRWETAEPKQKQSLKLAARLNHNRKTATELAGWKGNREEWHKQLTAIMEVAPPTIQATTLVIALDRQSKENNSPPMRHFNLTLAGKTSGENAKQVVKTFRERIETHPATAGLVKTVTVENYAADVAATAGEFDRVFQIESQYHGLPKEPTP